MQGKCKWAENEVAVSVDMQKVMLPRFPGLKQAIVCRRIVLFNEIFALFGGWKRSKSLKPTGVVWHEAMKGRLTENAVSAFIRFIRKTFDIQSFYFLG